MQKLGTTVEPEPLLRRQSASHGKNLDEIVPSLLVFNVWYLSACQGAQI